MKFHLKIKRLLLSIGFTLFITNCFSMTAIDVAQLSDSYNLKYGVLDFLYFYVALIGFYVAIILNFTKNTDRVSTSLMSGFILVHAFFILDFVLYNTNYQLKYAHTYLMSASVALLYGPLLYFYFKRINNQHKFKALDALHLLPTMVLLFFLFPLYSLPLEEKMKIQLGTSSVYTESSFFYIVFIPKLVSLIIYGFLISKNHLKSTKSKLYKNLEAIAFWKKGVYRMHVLFVVSYFIYGISISGLFFNAYSFIYQIVVVAMTLMVLYISYMAQVQPKVFSKEIILKNTEFFSKYQKSGLTKSLSNELKQNLIMLMVDHKIFMDNSLNLESLSEKLETSRHNTSQIINEHFNMNFFELVNKFRVEEAIQMLKLSDKNTQIIDVAYAVGYNNKVTFNKAFKKETSLTPSQFLKSVNEK
ncbi:AraC family transcriptional regulator [Gaetbulibacter jejuensis]|uniref:helix-turn-helix domain-containing protein n=1 Tax=Gaetbulibacter jejuensis TaxID=584607 RepID=UPI003007FBEE